MGLPPLFLKLRRLLLPAVSVPVPIPIQPHDSLQRLSRRRNGRTPFWSASAALVLACVPAAWASSEHDAHGIVAAGFGYQAGDVSSITVRTYDPSTGAVLSDETYELNVNEEGAADTSPPGERIFAGGVGHGATGLSHFTIRVYDAATGTFLWEGNLNLTPGGADEPVHRQPVLERRPRQASVTRASHRNEETARPSFLVRAMDQETGGLVWEDQFSTDAGTRLERIGYRSLGSHDPAARVPHQFDFRIRMWDGDGRRLLWEDKFEGIVPGEEETSEVEERAQFIPPWSGRDRHLAAESIAYRREEGGNGQGCDAGRTAGAFLPDFADGWNVSVQRRWN